MGVHVTIEFREDTRKRLIASIQRYAEENLDESIGDLKATLLLDFILKECGPSIYNQAILDAQAVLQERVSDLEESCYQPEFSYWDR